MSIKIVQKMYGAMLLLLLLVTTGCITGHTGAKRIVEAPNHHDPIGADRVMIPLWQKFETNFTGPGTVCPFIYLRVPVGPPRAELSVIEFTPQDYHLKLSTDADPVPGEKHRPQFWVTPDTNAMPRPAPPDRHATIFILHGYMFNKETMAGWAFLLAQSGYRTVLVDIRGHGQSTGDEVSFGKHEVEDFRQLLDYLTAHGLCDEKVGVLGYSYGADLALHWAAHDPRVRTVVAIAPYNNPEQAIERLAQQLKIHITRRSLQKATALAAAHMDINWADWSGQTAMSQIKVPVLLIGGGKDLTSRPDDIEAMHRAAAGESEVIENPLVDHSMIEVWYHTFDGPVQKWFDEKLGK